MAAGRAWKEASLSPFLVRWSQRDAFSLPGQRGPHPGGIETLALLRDKSKPGAGDPLVGLLRPPIPGARVHEWRTPASPRALVPQEAVLSLRLLHDRET